MPSNISFIPEAIERFIEKINNVRRTEAEIRLDEATLRMAHTIDVIVPGQHASIMKISAAEANYLALHVRQLGRQHPQRPMKVLDIGTFTGRSALAMAQAMPYGGIVLSCDINTEFASVAQKYWREAGVESRIEFRLQPALEVFQHLLDKGESSQFDLVFIDADKDNYDSYYEKSLELVRPGGIIILDNMLWSGRVADPDINDSHTGILRNLNNKISLDQRVDAILLGFEDGIIMVEKRIL